jgi:hypothetical protein
VPQEIEAKGSAFAEEWEGRVHVPGGSALVGVAEGEGTADTAHHRRGLADEVHGAA